MKSEARNRNPHWWRYLNTTLLVLSIGVTVGFFLSNWLINADIGGRHDFGMAIAMAFGSALGLYVSVILVAMDCMVALIGTLTRLPSRQVWLAAVVALAPVGWLVFTG